MLVEEGQHRLGVIAEVVVGVEAVLGLLEPQGLLRLRQRLVDPLDEVDLGPGVTGRLDQQDRRHDPGRGGQRRHLGQRPAAAVDGDVLGAVDEALGDALVGGVGADEDVHRDRLDGDEGHDVSGLEDLGVLGHGDDRRVGAHAEADEGDPLGGQAGRAPHELERRDDVPVLLQAEAGDAPVGACGALAVVAEVEHQHRVAGRDELLGGPEELDVLVP